MSIKSVKPSGGRRVFCLLTVLAAAGLPWTLNLTASRGKGSSSQRAIEAYIIVVMLLPRPMNGIVSPSPRDARVVLKNRVWTERSVSPGTEHSRLFAVRL